MITASKRNKNIIQKSKLIEIINSWNRMYKTDYVINNLNDYLRTLTNY